MNQVLNKEIESFVKQNQPESIIYVYGRYNEPACVRYTYNNVRKIKNADKQFYRL